MHASIDTISNDTRDHATISIMETLNRENEMLDFSPFIAIIIKSLYFFFLLISFMYLKKKKNRRKKNYANVYK